MFTSMLKFLTSMLVFSRFNIECPIFLGVFFFGQGNRPTAEWGRALPGLYGIAKRTDYRLSTIESGALSSTCRGVLSCSADLERLSRCSKLPGAIWSTCRGVLGCLERDLERFKRCCGVWSCKERSGARVEVL